MHFVEIFNPSAGSWPGELELRQLRAVMEEFWTGGCILTGGCLRDHWYSGGRLAPKDIDIAVFDMDESHFHDFHCALENRGWVHKTTDHLVDGVPQHKEPSEADAERINRVWQMIAPTGRLVDILLYADGFQTEQEVVLSHDHSINMFCGYVDDDEAATFRVTFPWGNMGRCYQMRDAVSVVRCEHMRDTCERLGVVYWNIIKSSHYHGQYLSEAENLHRLGVPRQPFRP